jgi:hypothetical protein
MPTRKQRRRREKDRRHEWEDVYVDAEGHEVDPTELEEPEPTPRNGRAPAAAKATAPAKSSPAKKGGPQRGGRVVQPPSWSRVLKRGLIFAPIMFIVIGLLSRKVSIEARLVQTVILLVFFVPFSYLMDSMMYRSYLRRTGATDERTSARKR